MKTLLEVVQLSTEYLKGRGVDNPRREAEWLVVDALALKDRLQLYMDHDRPLNAKELVLCRSWLARRGSGEPLQYIRGYVDFYGCRLHVDKRVLIPRQETELLVDLVVKKLEDGELAGKKLWDLCTGSGCIAIALKKRLPMLHVIGSDLSLDALAVAAENGKHNAVDVIWQSGDFLEPMVSMAPIDYLICNPPYVTTLELSTLAREVRDHEPHIALGGGVDGLFFYRKLAASAATYLTPGGLLWLEIGAEQGPAVAELFSGGLWRDCQLHRDLAGHNRFFTVTKA